MSLNIRSYIVQYFFYLSTTVVLCKNQCGLGRDVFLSATSHKASDYGVEKDYFSEMGTIRVQLFLDENAKYLSNVILSLLREVLLVPDLCFP